MKRIYHAKTMLLVGTKAEVMPELRRLAMRYGGQSLLSHTLQDWTTC